MSSDSEHDKSMADDSQIPAGSKLKLIFEEIVEYKKAGVPSPTTRQEYDRLMAARTEFNRGLNELKLDPDLAKGLRAQFNEAFGVVMADGAFQPFAMEDETKTAETKRVATLAQRANKKEEVNGLLEKNREVLSQNEIDTFVKHYEVLPDFLKDTYLNMARAALSKSSLTKRVTAFRGMLFELGSRARIASCPDAKLSEFNQDFSLEFVGYKPNTPFADLSDVPTDVQKPRESKGKPIPNVQIDVGIDRGGKPYIVETKSYTRRVLGREHEVGSATSIRNQVLKYQKAYEGGIIAGATIEFTGRIDKAFYNWFIGEHGTRPAPAVEIVCRMPLPSGGSYGFVLVSPSEAIQGLNLVQDTDYTQEDQTVIEGIQRAFETGKIVDILEKVNLNAEAVGIPQDAIDNPDKIEDLRVLRIYLEERNKSIWRDLGEL
ncbi:MAG: hypothetical protein Q8P62_05655 [Candidatus Peregrinibacteria bacterium]|nr:hypothetical protein [Candidatus Peregrinibacteria bacterium]